MENQMACLVNDPFRDHADENSLKLAK